VKCLFFAESRARTNLSQKEIFLKEGATIQDLVHILLQQHPQLAGILDHCIFAVNQEYLEKDPFPLSEGDEVAVIPPLSGG